MSAANLAGHLQRFFTDRLLGQLGPAHTQSPAIETPSDSFLDLLPSITVVRPVI